MYRSLALFATLLAVQAATIGDADPYLWLEDVTGEKALDWVRSGTPRPLRSWPRQPEFQALNERLLKILDSKERIPFVAKRGALYYNFWRDEQNQRGLWRRTTLEEYRKAEPAWETVLDLDALAAGEKENWVWHGPTAWGPSYERCLVLLSRGGADAERRPRVRPEDQGVREGRLHAARGQERRRLEGRDTLFVGTDFGPGSLTKSGYPRIVKEWKRGTPLDDGNARVRGQKDDVAVAATRDLTPGFERDFVLARSRSGVRLFLRRDGKLDQDRQARRRRRPASTASGSCSRCARLAVWRARPIRPARCWPRTSKPS